MNRPSKQRDLVESNYSDLTDSDSTRTGIIIKDKIFHYEVCLILITLL